MFIAVQTFVHNSQHPETPFQINILAEQEKRTNNELLFCVYVIFTTQGFSGF